MATLNAHELVVGWANSPVARLAALAVSSGEIVVIAGPNGAGKSTVVKTLARQIAPIEGKIKIDELDTSLMPVRDFARMVAYVPQLIEIPQRMSVDELIALGRNPYQIWWNWQVSDDDTKAVETALEKTEMAHLRKRAIADLSGGERQRAAIAMALAQQAKFILLDEPTAHLDFRHQLQLLQLLKQLRNSGIGILMVLHDLNMTARIADRVVLLAPTAANDRCSTIACDNKPELVFTESILQSVYQVQVEIAKDPITGRIHYMPTKAL